MTCYESTCQRRSRCNSYQKAAENEHPATCYDYLIDPQTCTNPERCRLRILSGSQGLRQAAEGTVTTPGPTLSDATGAHRVEMLEKRIALIDYQMDERKDKREIMVHELYELQQDLQKDGAGVPK